MNNKNFYVGMSMGLMVASAAAMIVRPRKKRCMKSAIGKALHTMGEMADSISDTMGW